MLHAWHRPWKRCKHCRFYKYSVLVLNNMKFIICWKKTYYRTQNFISWHVEKKSRQFKESIESFWAFRIKTFDGYKCQLQYWCIQMSITILMYTNVNYNIDVYKCQLQYWCIQMWPISLNTSFPKLNQSWKLLNGGYRD